MILQKIELHNFGIYGGDASFDLTPQGGEQFHRPIILFRGKNGVGKSTLAEAMRLCLHGKLSLGGRTRQRDYEIYLQQRLHRDEGGETAVSAHIILEFEHVLLGHRQQYRVKRAWKMNRRHLTIELQVWIDDELLNETDDEKEYLLRELIPVGVAELFFFDGEKISTLSEDGAGSADLLADTVKNLLGLHLVEQLDRDLDIYLTRQTGIQELQEYQTELAELYEKETELTRLRRDNHEDLAHCRRQLNDKREQIVLLDEQIAREGGRYAENQKEREVEQQEIIAAIALVEQEIYELSRGLMPFSVAPNLLKAVQTRLKQEAGYERWEASQPVLQELECIIREQPAVYHVERETALPEKEEPEPLITAFQAVLEKHKEPPMPASEIVHHVSGEKRGVLLNWIDEALTTAPRQMADALQKRTKLQNKLKAIIETMSRIPVMKILQPLQDELRQLERSVGHSEAELERLTAEDTRLTFHLEQNSGSNRRVTEQIASINTDEYRIKLAARTKLLLGDYQKKLTKRKLDLLATQLRQRFNQLSRKRNFIDRISIDPETFGMTLYRAGKPFPRRQLSAGEEQMFAIATLWALREVSGQPLPVIIDTPLSRLDEDHRRTMLVEFMPQVAQQVIVLATTAEIDDETFEFMKTAVSRAYLLEADKVSAQSKEQTVTKQQSLIAIDSPDAEITTQFKAHMNYGTTRWGRPYSGDQLRNRAKSQRL